MANDTAVLAAMQRGGCFPPQPQAVEGGGWKIRVLDLFCWLLSKPLLSVGERCQHFGLPAPCPCPRGQRRWPQQAGVRCRLGHSMGTMLFPKPPSQAGSSAAELGKMLTKALGASSAAPLPTPPLQQRVPSPAAAACQPHGVLGAAQPHAHTNPSGHPPSRDPQRVGEEVPGRVQEPRPLWPPWHGITSPEKHGAGPYLGRQSHPPSPAWPDHSWGHPSTPKESELIAKPSVPLLQHPVH